MEKFPFNSTLNTEISNLPLKQATSEIYILDVSITKDEGGIPTLIYH